MGALYYELMVNIRPNTILRRHDPRTGMVYTGRSFHKSYRFAKFVKVLDKSLTHYGMDYKTGLNIDVKRFEERVSNCDNGLYFFRIPLYSKHVNDDLGQYMTIYGNIVADVTIPDDAKVVVESSTDFKCNKFVLSNFRNLNTLFSPTLIERLNRPSTIVLKK